jgi:hypothetical protein
VDHTLGTHDSIFGHYVYQGAITPTIGVDPYFGTAPTTRNQSVGVQYVHTFGGAKLNEFRFGYNRGGAEQFSTRRGTGFTAAKDLGINGLLVGGPGGRPLEDFENGFPSSASPTLSAWAIPPAAPRSTIAAPISSSTISASSKAGTR